MKSRTELARSRGPAALARCSLLLLTLLLGGCAVEVAGFANDKSFVARLPPPQTAPAAEAVVGEDGHCSMDMNIDKAALQGRDGDALIGITECELVAIRGEPLSVQTGASSSAKRETTMLYMEPTGKAIYLFANNRLTKVVR